MECLRSFAEERRWESVLPFALFGDVEILADRNFTARVETVESCHVLSVPRPLFLDVLNGNRDAQVTVYRNLTHILTKQSDDLDGTGQAGEKEQLKERIDSLEHQVQEVTAPLSSALSPLVEGQEALANVLVVDDEPECRWLVKKVLSRCQVSEVGSGSEALEAVREHVPDLVITDIRMAQMDGCTLLMNLRATFPDLPVIAVSGVLDMDSLRHYDFNAFIDKPIEPKQLCDTVASALPRRRRKTDQSSN
ncbi:MAG: CheY-like chemotaxis protein [Planctomycetota bacterium]